MDIITVASSKGGVGKTKASKELYFTLERDILLNLDSCGTYELTNALREKNERIKINFLNITSLEQFKLAIKKYADRKIVIDCGGYQSALTMAAMSAATTIITPINDSIDEIASLKHVNSALASISEKTGILKTAYVLINRVQHNKKSFPEFNNLTRVFSHLQRLESTISYKKALLESATLEGLTIPEYELKRVQAVRAKQAKEQQKMDNDKANGKTITLKKFVTPTLNKSVSEIYALTDEIKTIINT
ncbi:Putative uncharacterized protein [Moritella viscosa]|uniref:Uncharacterized protein n=1 Tax=Moritella viscosa TaxID=80854 RepID=A0A1K9ZCL6_9GAMM|nr:ParA family protein [Moritella viscosa]SGY94714.1 Putative uncharacterized protein [Moritella viscosa]SHO23901.1 Putative uncharacterized protein [Moritella viscosa]